MANAWRKIQDVENKYIGQIVKNMPVKDRKKFLKRMRGKGVEDARKDQLAGVKSKGVSKHKPDGSKNPDVQGHHKDFVSRNPEKMTDPSNNRFMDKEAHKRYHRLVQKFEKKYGIKIEGHVMDQINVTSPKKTKKR